MALTTRDPDTIYLGGDITRINDIPAVEAITPGYLLEYHNDSSVLKWGVMDSADAGTLKVFALDRPYLNKGVDDAYVAGEPVDAAAFHPGSTVWAVIPSGVTANYGSLLQSNGDGKLKALGSGTLIGACLDNPGAVTADTRVRVEVA